MIKIYLFGKYEQYEIIEIEKRAEERAWQK